MHYTDHAEIEEGEQSGECSTDNVTNGLKRTGL